jgi:hypothetical protein
MDQLNRSLADVGRRGRFMRNACFTVIFASLLTSQYLLWSYRELSGPGDQLDYYKQAAKLLPFTHYAYGPVYFVVIRFIHDVFNLDWFLVSKITSWFSALGFLVICHYLFKRVLGESRAWLGTLLVAVNPTFIGESYDALTVMLGSVLVLTAVFLTLSTRLDRPQTWFVPGLMFAIAYLTRFQALGLVLGALFGIFFIPSGRLTFKIKSGLMLLLGAALPVLLWNGLLLWYQGFIPQNRNYLHLAVPLVSLQSWSDAEALHKYHSFWDVLTSDWSAPLRIAGFAAHEAVKFPFGIGYQLLFVGAGWLVPGAVIAAGREEHRRPWLFAFVLGLVATGIGSLGWVHYYLVFIPFAVILIAFAIENLASANLPRLAAWSWAIVIGSTLIWSPVNVRATFLNTYWPEFTVAKQFLEARRNSQTVVSTTAAGFSYGTTMSFVDFDDVLQPNQTGDLVMHLRDRGVTDLVITERHTLFNFPDLKYLLNDNPGNVPSGLERELLLKVPQRLAIYKVLPDDGTKVR